MTTLDSILARIDYLPPFPITVSRGLAMLNNPSTTTEQIAETIKFDPAIATNVLKLCNSSYFGLRRSVTNLTEALVYIGLSQLRKILTLSGSQHYFENILPGYEDFRGELWRHSLATAILAEHISTRINKSSSDTAFITGLLHDVGKLVLSEFVSSEATQIGTIVESEHISFLDAERRVLGIDHGELGARVLGLWHFPEEIVTAVGRHHKPYEDTDDDLTNCIRLADELAILMGYGTTVDGLSYIGHPQALTRYGLSQATLDRLMDDAVEQIIRIETEYGLFKKE